MAEAQEGGRMMVNPNQAEFGAILVTALCRIQEADPGARGTVNGNVLELATVLSRDEAAGLMLGLRPPVGMRFEWSTVDGAADG